MLLALMVQAVISVVRVCFIAFGLAGDDYEAVDNTFTITLAGMTTIIVLTVARRMREARPRRAWTILALAAGANCIGDTLYTFVTIATGEAQFPSIADAAYLAFYPLMLLGLLAFHRQREAPSERLKFWLDALTTTVGGGLLFWYFLIEPMTHAEQPSLLASLVGVAYPVADLVLILGIATVALRTSNALSRRTCCLLGGSVVAFMFGDVAYSGLNVSNLYEAGSPLSLLSELPFTVSYLLLSVAAAVELAASRKASDGVTPDARPVRPLSTLPYVAVALGYGLLLWVSFGDIPESVQGVIFGAVLLTALVVARQIVAVRENARLLMEQAERRSEARFQSLVQQATDVITIVDADGMVIYQTPSLERVFGYAPATILGRHVLDVIHPDDQERGRQFLAAARRPGSTGLSLEWRVKHRDGRWRYVETVVTNLLGDSDVAGLVLTSRDDTERRMLAN